MAIAISMTIATEKKRVNKPSTIAMPPKNSVPAERYAIHEGSPSEPTLSIC